MNQLQPSFADRTDFENAARGFIGTLDPCVIRTENGRIVWNAGDYNFLNTDSPCPSTVNPKLWRHAQLTSQHGLFKVTEGIYQVRGFDLSNMTIVEGEKGILVIDPLVSIECATAALSLYRTYRGQRPVTGLIYSHSHIDHYGGAEGVLPLEREEREKIPILAPEGFLEEAASENIYLGPAMRRRAAYMYGNRLPKDTTGLGHVGCGIGMAVSTGTNSLIPPTDYIRRTGEERIVDGIRIVFQMVPEAEAPSEMNFYFPDVRRRALYIAECATHTLHNIITLRGAVVRDAKAWARYLDESLVLFGERTDALLAGHHWPTWGEGEIAELLSEQRDLYAYLHDQTVRMMNFGMNGTEIAEVLTLPPKLAQAWHAQGFYGSLSHNIKGIYQRYMGWFDGDPARLWEHPAAATARRYVDCMGGVDAVLQKAGGYIRDGDLRFAATLLNHAVTVEPQHEGVREALAGVYRQLGFGAENATWRNFYLSGAMAVGSSYHGKPSLPPQDHRLRSTDSFEQWLEVLSVRLDGPQAASGTPIIIDIMVADEDRWWRVIVSNGAMTYRTALDQAAFGEPAGLSFAGTKSQLHGILNGDAQLKETTRSGDWSLLFRLLRLTGMRTEPSHL
ncbi:beta-lactamase-like protein [Aspergillus granulosus]|uniref:Beta-lactamase-like protein n=1 Tax=Aspergillus granulosus TaxID=176169 RepID=A0ABR4GV51_9EURO